MFRIKAIYQEQFEFDAGIDRVREFFSELRNFVELMPNIESIKKDANGVIRWVVRADIPVVGALREGFLLEQTENEPDRIEWSPAKVEQKNYMRYAASFIEESATKTIVKMTQQVELRRQNAKDLHRLASLVGENKISTEMQKRVNEMIKTFLKRARTRIEGLK